MTLSALGIFSAAGVSGFSSDYELISTTLISTNTASVTFDVTGLGSTYKHLQVRIVSRQNNDNNLRINNDSGNNYSYHAIYGNGSSVLTLALASTNRGYVGYRGSGVTNGFSVSIVDFLDAFSTTKNKTIRTLNGQAEGSSNNFIFLSSSAYYSTSATTSISFFGNGGDNFQAGSRLSIYGIKG
jgi:hypothetical protein